MGNLCAILAPKPAKRKPIKRLPNPSAQPNSSNRWTRVRSSRKEKLDDALIQEQALAAAILFQQHQQNGSLPFDRSASLRYPNSTSKKGSNALPRSSSSRARSLTDPLLQPHQLVNQDVKLDDLETNHFVLVHGGGFGAWCWYKTIALLEEGGFKVTAVDLTGSGIHSSDTNSVTSLSQYVKPLSDFLEKLPEGKKVILAGHDFGGACVSYAMELFPDKVAKAIFIAAAMLKNGQSTLEMFSQQASSDDLMRQAQVFLYANGNDRPPTAIDLDKSLLKDLLFNQSPAKDVTLASVSMRPIPFAPVLEKLSLSDLKYGSVRRFYIETSEDNAIPTTVQESMIKESPPEQVLRLKGLQNSGPKSKRKQKQRKENMGRGVSCGGGKSSLGYLFGGGETATANKTPKTTNSTPPPPQNASPAPAPAPAPSPAPASSPSGKQLPAGIHSKPTNNYLRVDGQNCGNFITDRPSTKVHAAPGGGSSLGYLFGGGSGN